MLIFLVKASELFSRRLTGFCPKACCNNVNSKAVTAISFSMISLFLDLFHSNVSKVGKLMVFSSLVTQFTSTPST